MRPPTYAIEVAERTAARSPCSKSKRGVAIYCQPPSRPMIHSTGFNGPPGGAPCPGRERCGDSCGKRCVHAEMRALRGVEHPGHLLDLVHVKLGDDGRVTPGGPPSCWQCSREILDVGIVAGVWLYEVIDGTGVLEPGGVRLIGAWRYYTAEDFHRVTLKNAGIEP